MKSWTTSTNLKYPLNLVARGSCKSSNDYDFYDYDFSVSNAAYNSLIEDLIKMLKKESAEITEREFLDLLEGDE